ncbi:MAG: Rad2 nuclease [Candelina submexicana]|nr:MAG: Rad2 nuclease [Candelina submexicana]
MGISGLLPLLKSIQKPCNLKKFRGQTIGVDAYGWLHRGTVACAIELALGTPTSKYVDFAMSRVRMLIHFGITPYLIFDGDYLPSKAMTEVERAKKRQESRRLGLELHKLGRTSQAHLELQKAVDVTPQMAGHLIEELKQIGVQYVVAPYEADAQLAYMERKGIINGILSEDSDLLVFGAKCLLTKLDQYGECVEINRDDFTACRDISLVGWSETDFRRMAILSGCDYLPSISKMGLKKAYRLVRTHKTVDRILRTIQFDGQFRVPTGYLEAFQQAELTFLHQWVFCPVAKSLVMNTEPGIGINVDELSFVGRYVEQDIAQGVARGDLDPMTKRPISVDLRNTSDPRTSWRAKKQVTKTESVDLKCGVSIESFFKTKRMPLTELDPNSFTPSPSQQRLLQRNLEPWSASPVPSRSALGQSMVSASGGAPLAPSSAPSMTRAARDHSFNRAVSASRPLKRPRLCSDSHEGASQTGEAEVNDGRSRFFEPSKPKLGSSATKTDIVKRSRRPEVNIWSDDSIEGIMADLPDISDTPTIARKEKLTIFEDETEHSSATGRLSQQTLATTSQSSETIVKSQGSDSADSQDTAATSVHSSAISQSPENPFDVHVSAELRALRAKFSYQATQKPETLNVTTKSQVLPSPSQKPALQDGPRPALLPSVSMNSIIKPAIGGKGDLTALQRLGARALNRTQSFSTPIQTNSVLEAVQVSLPVPESTPNPKVATGALKVTREPRDSKFESTSIASINRGSEDLLIPDSEDDGHSEVSGSGNEELKKPTLDLGRFAFTPKAR